MGSLSLWLFLAIVIGVTAAKHDTLERLLKELASKSKKAHTPSLHLKQRATNEANCGVNKYNNQVKKRSTKLQQLLRKILKDDKKSEKLAARILEGREAKPGEFPWISFIINEGFDTQCGGSLIAPQWVVTAAHCMYGAEEQGYPFAGNDITKIKLYLGEHNAAEDVKEASEIRMNAEKVFVHPQFNINDYGNNHDIALVKLQSAITYSANIVPICIPTSAIPAGTQCFSSGWGIDKNGNVPDILHTVELRVISIEQCRQSGHSPDPGMLCAGKPPGVNTADSCRGDSGGPLSCLINGKFYLAGATSFGADCTASHLSGDSPPGIYSDVFHYKQWIDSVINGNGGSTPSGGGDNGGGGGNNGGGGNGGDGGDGGDGGSDGGNWGDDGGDGGDGGDYGGNWGDDGGDGGDGGDYGGNWGDYGGDGGDEGSDEGDWGGDYGDYGDYGDSGGQDDDDDSWLDFLKRLIKKLE